MASYVGITIGPIFDTIQLTSSPASLWSASYLFSSLTRTLCQVLTEEYGVKQEQIISPYYRKDDPLLNRNNGVGLFHDRIIFRAEGFDVSRIGQLRQRAIEKVARQLGLEKHIAYLTEYLQIAAAPFEAENPILESGKLLDCLELARPFVFREEHNPILGLFTNSNEESEQEGKNEAVKKLTLGFENFQLRKHSLTGNGVLKSLSDIVRTGKHFKKYRYYAIVRSDGDNMSKIISTLSDDGKITDFSRTCMQYCDAVADAVAQYDGVTIYAGGDDLLAILPCESADGKTVFSFMAQMNDIFAGYLKQNDLPVTSLSFGVTVAYYKFPLYEALADSAQLLFDVAKKRKDCAAIRLQKNAGQTEGLLITNDRLRTFAAYLEQVKNNRADTLLSAMHKLALFKSSFHAAQDYETVYNLFVNTFDAAYHTGNTFVHKTLPDMLWELKQQTKTSGIYALTEDGEQTEDTVLIIHYMLRILKFFVEKEGE